MFKELICKLMNLVPASVVEYKDNEIAYRDLFVNQIAEAIQSGPISVMTHRQTMVSKNIDSPIFVVGDSCKIVDCTVLRIHVYPGAKSTYMSNIDFKNQPSYCNFDSPKP